MYFYKIGYSTYEGGGDNQYFHSEKFTEEEIDVLIEQALFEAYKKLKTEDNYSTTRIEYLMEDNSFHEYFLRNGFLPVKYEVNKFIFGWNDILGDIWENPTTPEERLMLARLKKRIEEFDKVN